MKKISKILLSPLPVVAALPTVVFATSCNNFDFTKALEWYETELAKAQAAFEATTQDENLKKGLSNVAEIERLFIQNKVNFHWRQTIINFRQDKYDEEHGVQPELCEAWDSFYGSSGDERKLYTQYKQEHSNEWLQLVSGEALVKSCNVDLDFYQTLSVFNAFVAEKGEVLRDLIGWAFHIIEDADSVLTKWTESYSDTAFYGDVDGANVGYIYSTMDTPYKSPSLALYKYYTEYKDTALQDKLSLYRTKVLGLDPSWDDEQIYAHLYSKLTNNYYLLLYTENYTDIKFDKAEHLSIVADCLSNFIKRIYLRG